MEMNGKKRSFEVNCAAVLERNENEHKKSRLDEDDSSSIILSDDEQLSNSIIPLNNAILSEEDDDIIFSDEEISPIASIQSRRQDTDCVTVVLDDGPEPSPRSETVILSDTEENDEDNDISFLGEERRVRTESSDDIICLSNSFRIVRPIVDSNDVIPVSVRTASPSETHNHLHVIYRSVSCLSYGIHRPQISLPRAGTSDNNEIDLSVEENPPSNLTNSQTNSQVPVVNSGENRPFFYNPACRSFFDVQNRPTNNQTSSTETDLPGQTRMIQYSRNQMRNSRQDTFHVDDVAFNSLSGTVNNELYVPNENVDSPQLTTTPLLTHLYRQIPNDLPTVQNIVERSMELSRPKIPPVLLNKNDERMILTRINCAQLDSEDTVCAICLDSVTKKTKKIVVKLNSCSHIFHKTCILPWLKKCNGSCPLCRQSCYPKVSTS
ncbi:hypothetical protein SNEBB_009231 [Seison nebaliae]|nr:hypothetical protein SNEBB_009231 [Seison nebaliae]